MAAEVAAAARTARAAANAAYAAANAGRVAAAAYAANAAANAANAAANVADNIAAYAARAGAANAAAYAAANAARANAANAAANAADAADAADADADDQVWLSISADVQWLEESGSPEALIDQPLWHNPVRTGASGPNMPDWAARPYDAFRRADQGAGPWRPWLAWYEALLPWDENHAPRSAFGERADIELAIKPPDFWDRDPDVVMAEIAEIVGPLDGGAPDSDEAFETHGDAPTDRDLLGREPFVRALVQRIDEVRETGDGFAVHLHAPWGAGKTSILKIISRLNRERLDEEQWAIAEFNAWRNERRDPPWWPLMQAVKQGCSDRLYPYHFERHAALHAVWIWWWVKAHIVPIALALGTMAVGLYFAAQWKAEADEVIEQARALVTAGVTLIGAFGVFVLAGRTLVFGSANSARAYSDMTRDPLCRVERQFKTMIAITGRPVCIFIDDLDRCRASYAIALLEGIQTCFRRPDVVYVVAADRAWLQAAFETGYKDFKSHVGTAGQPLGYLFLEKIFQLSATVPGMSDDVRETYWSSLLNGRTPDAALKTPPEQAAQERAIEQDIVRQQVQSFAGMQDYLSQPGHDTAAHRSAAAMVLNRAPKAESERTHELAKFAALLPDNPRVMKRMINALAMRQVAGVLTSAPADGGDDGELGEIRVTLNALARWTILEQRYPALADLLSARPDLVDCIARGSDDERSARVPEVFRALPDAAAIRRIVEMSGEGREGDEDANGAPETSLTPDMIRAITGGAPA